MLLVECFQKIIAHKFHLSQAVSKDGIVVPERINGDNHSSLTFIGGKKIDCFGFTAEAGKVEPLALLANQDTDGVGLAGVRKMCDGIVVFSQGNQEYILGVELKQGGTASAHKQIQNAEILCKWLTELLNKHQHWQGKYKFCGIIAKPPRKTKNKGITRHGESFSPKKEGERITFTITNLDEVRLVNIARSINQA